MYNSEKEYSFHDVVDCGVEVCKLQLLCYIFWIYLFYYHYSELSHIVTSYNIE